MFLYKEASNEDVWNGLTGLLTIHPTITAELAALHEASKAKWCDWTGRMLTGLQIARYESVTAAAKASGTGQERILAILSCLKFGHNTVPFVEWISDQPELLGKVVKHFGMDDWPHLGPNLYFGYDASQDKLEALLPHLMHPELARAINLRFASQRKNSKRDCLAISLMENKLNLIGKIITEVNPKRITDLDDAFWEIVQTVPSEGPDRTLSQIRIEELNLSIQAYTCLKITQIHTLADLAEATRSDLLKINGLGQKGLTEIEAKLSQFRLTFKDADQSATDECLKC